MARLLAAPFVLLALSACMHNTVPVQSALGPELFGPLEARVQVSHFGGLDLTVDLSRPAYIAVFEVVPGSGTALLYPRLGQPALLDAGRNYPHILAGSLFRNASGSAYDWASRSVSGWRTSSSGWMQPRHIFLVASEMPLALDALNMWASRGVGVLTHPTFASFSAQATMGNLLDVVLPSASGGQWTTDVFTIWPEPPPMAERQRYANVTRVPVWLSCGGDIVFFAAGTPIGIIRSQLLSGCTIVAEPKKPTTTGDTVSTTPKPDTASSGTRTPPPDPRNPRAEPVRPRMPREAVLDPGTRRDALDEGMPNREAMTRAVVRAGGRAYRPGDVASERGELERPENDARARFQVPPRREADREARTTRPRLPGAVSSPASERARGSQVERTREQPRATPSRPRPAERARVEPTRARERSVPARERPSASERRRPEADPPRRAAPTERRNPPAAAPARTAPPRAERPTPPKTEPKETKTREVPPA